VAWTVDVSDEFAEWYGELTDDEHESVNFSVDLLEELGPSLGVRMSIRSAIPVMQT
jgi:hypothetical protein